MMVCRKLPRVSWRAIPKTSTIGAKHTNKRREETRIDAYNFAIEERDDSAEKRNKRK
jgi:hypothetical protein